MFDGPIRRCGIAGAHGTGKTWAIITSPYSPILLIDYDDGSRSYAAQPAFNFQRILADEARTIGDILLALDSKSDKVTVNFGGEPYEHKLTPPYGTIAIDTWSAFQALAAGAYFQTQPQRRQDNQGPLIWGEVKQHLAARVHSLGKHCNLLILTSHTRQAFGPDGQPVKQTKEAVFYDRIWQALDLVGFLSQAKGSQVPRVTFRPPMGKKRLPGLPMELPEFSWGEIFKYSIEVVDLPTPEARRAEIEKTLKAFKKMVNGK